MKATQSHKPLDKKDVNTLITYFLTALTVPEKDLWVNLSPYEKDRKLPDALRETLMGRDMLAQDYLLKQLAASLLHPDTDLGKTFWDKVYSKAQQRYGTTQIPVNTFNKVWIVADTAEVFEKLSSQRQLSAFITGAHLKVMLEEDYLAVGRNTHRVIASEAKQSHRQPRDMFQPQNIIRDLILPEIEKEINEGKNFAPLRQMFYAMILASWYKDTLRNSIITQVYGNKTKVSLLGYNGRQSDIEVIYQRYLQSFKKGVVNLIKEEPSDMAKAEGVPVPRKYFSGGLQLLPQGPSTIHKSQTPPSAAMLAGDFAMATVVIQPHDKAMGSRGDSAMSVANTAEVLGLEDNLSLARVLHDFIYNAVSQNESMERLKKLGIRSEEAQFYLLSAKITSFYQLTYASYGGVIRSYFKRLTELLINSQGNPPLGTLLMDLGYENANKVKGDIDSFARSLNFEGAQPEDVPSTVEASPNTITQDGDPRRFYGKVKYKMLIPTVVVNALGTLILAWFMIYEKELLTQFRPPNISGSLTFRVPANNGTVIKKLLVEVSEGIKDIEKQYSPLKAKRIRNQFQQAARNNMSREDLEMFKHLEEQLIAIERRFSEIGAAMVKQLTDISNRHAQYLGRTDWSNASHARDLLEEWVNIFESYLNVAPEGFSIAIMDRAGPERLLGKEEVRNFPEAIRRETDKWRMRTLGMETSPLTIPVFKDILIQVDFLKNRVQQLEWYRILGQTEPAQRLNGKINEEIARIERSFNDFINQTPEQDRTDAMNRGIPGIRMDLEGLKEKIKENNPAQLDALPDGSGARVTEALKPSSNKAMIMVEQTAKAINRAINRTFSPHEQQIAWHMLYLLSKYDVSRGYFMEAVTAQEISLEKDGYIGIKKDQKVSKIRKTFVTKEAIDKLVEIGATEHRLEQSFLEGVVSFLSPKEETKVLEVYAKLKVILENALFQAVQVHWNAFIEQDHPSIAQLLRSSFKSFIETTSREESFNQAGYLKRSLITRLLSLMEVKNERGKIAMEHVLHSIDAFLALKSRTRYEDDLRGLLAIGLDDEAMTAKTAKGGIDLNRANLAMQVNKDFGPPQAKDPWGQAMFDIDPATLQHMQSPDFSGFDFTVREIINTSSLKAVFGLDR